MQPHKICNHKPSYSINISASYSYSASFPAIVKKACYFMASPQVWTVHDSKPTFREGYNLGLANCKTDSIAFNIEFDFGLDVMLHEILHLKYPDWNVKIVQESADLVARDCFRFLNQVS